MVFDIAVVLIVCLSVALGAWKGFAWQLAGILSLLVGFAVALPLSAPLAEAFGGSGPFARLISIAILYLFVSLGIYLLAVYYRHLIQQWHLDPWDRHLGAIFGAVKGFVLCTVLTFFALTLFGGFREPILNTWTGKLMGKAVETVHPVWPEEVHTVLHPYLHPQVEPQAPETAESPRQPEAGEQRLVR